MWTVGEESVTTSISSSESPSTKELNWRRLLFGLMDAGFGALPFLVGSEPAAASRTVSTSDNDCLWMRNAFNKRLVKTLLSDTVILLATSLDFCLELLWISIPDMQQYPNAIKHCGAAECTRLMLQGCQLLDKVTKIATR